MKRHALFVGVDQYADGHIPNLSCAVSDATDLHGFFKYGAGYDRVELLSNPSGKKEVLGMVRELTSDLGSGDFFLFFFAGHGFRVGENHVLVCAKDLYEDVKYEDDGLPLGQLKRRLSGAFDSALLLDACQSDILATRGGEGIAERDLSLIHEAPPVRVGGGALTIVTSCDAGQTAVELSERRHGLFTVAMLDLLKEAQKAQARLDLSDAFRMSLGRRMGEIAARSGLSTEQRPRFSSTGDACFMLLDGVVQMASASQPLPSSHLPVATSALVVCPVCGKHNLVTDTFKCMVCGKDHLCMSHSSAEYRCCEACVGSAQNEGQRLAQEMYDKGEDYYYGRNGVGKDFAEAVKWYRKSAEKGYVVAQYYVGYAYESGEGVVQDYVEAYKWFVKAAESGHAKAQRRLGVLYSCGDGVEQDYGMALMWYRKAAEQGDAFAQFCLGECYYNGQGVTQDYTEAVKWGRRAAEQGDAGAQCLLGCCYEKGQGVEQDLAEATKWFRKAAEHGEAWGQYDLGNCYYYGRGVKESKREAVKWYRKAAEQGHSGSQYMLGKCYYHGRGVKESSREAMKWLRKAAEQGDSEAQNFLGECYFEGEGGVKRDVEEAVKWYRKAAEQGHVKAQDSLGCLYEYGDGVEEDFKEAAKWYRKAAEKGHDNAQYHLGEMYEFGKGVEQDYNEALTWYLRAAEQGYPFAYTPLANMYYKGKGIDRDYIKAIKWFHKAAAKGVYDAEAQKFLGDIYSNGYGVEEDYSEALTWYLKAAAQDVDAADAAKESLQLLLLKMYNEEGNIELAEAWCANIIAEGDEDEVEIVEEIKSKIEDGRN